MNKKMKIWIVGLVLLIGSNVYAQNQNWDNFRADVQDSVVQTITMSAYLGSGNILNWQVIFGPPYDDGSPNKMLLGAVGNKTFVGLSGINFAILDAGNNSAGFSFPNNNDIQFNKNFVFRNFSGIRGGNHIGGVILINTDVTFTNSETSFINNNSDGFGGAVGSTGGGGSLNFTGSTISFTNNKSSRGGGAIFGAGPYLSIDFEDSVVDFTNNTAIYEGQHRDSEYATGGAISGGNINFTGSIVNFSNNRADHAVDDDYFRDGLGGAIYGSNINFTSSTVKFSNNTAGIVGGAILLYRDGYRDGIISFINSSGIFINNRAQIGGGAISGNVLFTGSTVNFIGNKTTNWYRNGGAIVGDVTLIGSVVNFTENEVAENGHGGAIRGGVSFTSSTVNFTKNKATFGGAIAAYASIKSSFSALNFSNNAAGQKGGAIQISVQSVIDFSNGTVNFINNSAAYGGAINSEGAFIIIEDSNFRGNTAAIAGGAVLLTPGYEADRIGEGDTTIMWLIGNSTITIRAINRDVVFSNNKAGGAPNDIFVTEDGGINFYAQANRKIDLQGGIKVDDINISGDGDYVVEYVVKDVKIKKEGEGELILSGRNKLRGSLDIQAGKVTVKSGESFDVDLTSLTVREGAIYSTLDGNASQETKVTSGTQAQATINGTLALDVDFDLISGDKLTATNITFGGSSKISIDAFGNNYGSSITIVSANTAIDTDENINALIDRSGSVYDDDHLFPLQYLYGSKDENTKIVLYAIAPSSISSIADLSNGGFFDISDFGGSEINIDSPINISAGETVINSGGKTFNSDGANTGLSVSGAAAIAQINDLSFSGFDGAIAVSGGAQLTIAANTSDVVFKDNAIDLSVNAGGISKVRIIARDNRNVIFNDKVISEVGTDISKIGNGAVEFRDEVNLAGSLNIEQGYVKQMSSISVSTLNITGGAIEMGDGGYISADKLTVNSDWLSITDKIGVGKTIFIIEILDNNISDEIITSTITTKSSDGRYDTTIWFYKGNFSSADSSGLGISRSADPYGILAYVESRSGIADLISGSSISLSPVFIGNAIRQAAISDNSPIYSNVNERVWVAGQFGGGSLSDDEVGNFDNSAAGAKAGFTFVSGSDFSAGVFAGFASRSYKQDNNKASASDMDFGLYSGLGLGGNVSLAAFVGYGLQSINAKNAGDKADFDATIIKFGAKAEYAAGLISPFIGFEGAVVDVGEIDMKADGQGLKMDAVSYTRLSSQIGAKIGRNVGGFSWFGKAYVDLLLAGNKPQYSVKPYYENDEVKTAAAKSKTIDATEESAASFGLGAGLSIPVSGAVDIFASAETKLNADFFGYQGNIGASFKF